MLFLRQLVIFDFRAMKLKILIQAENTMLEFFCLRIQIIFQQLRNCGIFKMIHY